MGMIGGTAMLALCCYSLPPGDPASADPVAFSPVSAVEAPPPAHAVFGPIDPLTLRQDPTDDDAQPAVEPATGGSGVFDHAGEIPLELGGVAAGITAIGIANWNWGNSSFRFNSEGWFGRETSSFGMDKLGHAYSSFVITEFLGASIRANAANPRHAQRSAALMAAGLMTYVEIFDGFSGDHGFSWEDMASNATGIGLSVLRHQVPGLNDKLDFRMEYLPSGERGFRPLSDYAGQRYLLAVKLAGFKPLERGPMRFVEVHGGYYARGFTEWERDRGVEPRRALYVGIGLNVQQLLSRRRGEGRSWRRAARSALEYVQIPYTSVRSR
ncbi:DUF2279 domain-containing protein [Sphingomonas sp. CJ99]